MHPETLTHLVRDRRPDLIILTDDVYATFVDGFRSVASVAPHNTILVYSYSKYFGATGWRLGVIGLHQDNILDRKIAALPPGQRDALRERYGRVELDPDDMKLIERLCADSSSVALHHTAGLSTPQQVMMTLFSLYCLVDTEKAYRREAQSLVIRRYRALYEALDSFEMSVGGLQRRERDGKAKPATSRARRRDVSSRSRAPQHWWWRS